MEQKQTKHRNAEKCTKIGEDELVKIIKRRPNTVYGTGGTHTKKPRPRSQNVMTNESRKQEEFYAKKICRITNESFEWLILSIF